MSRTAVSGKRILFLHGLESGPTGAKARYLQEHFETVVVPDLRMSVWDLKKENSAVRNFMSLQRSMEGCINVALDAIAAEYRDVDLSGVKNGMTLLSEAQARAVNESLIIVGSSWGGGLALKLLERGIHPHATVLLAPALRVNGWLSSLLWPTWSPVSLPDGGRGVVLFHGDCDATVPVEGSRDLKAQYPDIVYRELPGGDHRLNAALIDPSDGHPTGRLRAAVKLILDGNFSRL
mmetsp:Transcript_30253/g.40401  ORF Transcript_30253/g.40401 Transcript_30253/m.40401 type:complete len:235 (-) Transcript_30253:1456-2160(-)